MTHMTPNAPGAQWTPDDLRFLLASPELEIAPPDAGGKPGPWTPIWVVVVDGEVFVRTWHRRTTGWYGRAVRSGRARARVSGDPIDVHIAAAGDADADAIDAAYRTKYGMAGAQSMITAEAAASTLRLTRAA